MRSVEIKTLRDLAGRIVWVSTNTSTYSYPRFGKTLEEAWEELQSGIRQMAATMGAARTAHVLDMCDQAQQHFRVAYATSPQAPPKVGEPGFEDLKLGTRLMQDVEWVARGREPFAYPKELCRWPQIAGSRAAGDPDLEQDFLEKE
jgi:hypothetical protein